MQMVCFYMFLVYMILIIIISFFVFNFFLLLFSYHCFLCFYSDNFCQFKFIIEFYITLLIHVGFFAILHKKINLNHCVKSVRIRSFSGPYFSAFGLNTDRYEVSLRIQSKCGKTGKYGPEKLGIRTLFTQ